MPGATEGPSVALSFANNFWGKDDAGVSPLLERMAAAKQTNDELRAFYSARASIEDEYARKLMSLSRKPLGSHEMGSLKTSLDTVRGEVELMAKQHGSIAAQMKTELEEPLAAFAGGMKERRKIIQNTVEKLLKVKIQQTQAVNKTRDRYEQECLKIKGYLAQGHMVMGQEERQNKAKLEKTQISVATTNTEYENAVKALEDTTARWNREWKAAADKFQDLEEERLDFTKSSLWTFANVASTVCVSDDASCEKIRLSLEKLDVENDIMHFISEKGTGQEIPDPPKYINFCRGDVEDPQPEPIEEDNYSVAQFPRSINPAFRSSSPQPSTFESHHDPNSALARDLSHNESPAAPPPNQDPAFPPSREPAFPPQKAAVPSIPLQSRHQPQDRHQGNAMQQYDPYHDSIPPLARDKGHHNLARLSSREAAQPVQRAAVPTMPPQERRQGNGGVQPYDTSQFAEVPHDPYPMDGMTMLCRTDGMNSATSSNLSARPSSRDDNSDYSNPTSLSSQEPQSGKVSPAKQEPVVEAQPDKRVLKKKSGFFQNHSPFRRKSVKEVQQQQPSRNTWGPVSSTQNGPTSRRPHHAYQPSEPRNMLPDRTASPEPIDANASLALNVGQNVFPVADTRKKSTDSGAPPEEQDPIALALAELKEVAGNKKSAGRISADHYHGIVTPVPDRTAERPQSQGFSRPAPVSKPSSDVAAAIRGTPPPSYDQQISRLGVPPPAVTSRAMQESSRKYTEKTREMFKPSQPTSRPYASTPTRPTTRGTDIPRATSPAPPRSASPRPGTHAETRQQPRAPSPNPYSSSAQSQAQRAPSPNPYAASQIPKQKPPAPNTYGTSSSLVHRALPSSSYSSNPRQAQRAASPNPYSPITSQNPTQEAPSPSSFSSNRTPTQKAAPPSSYNTRENRAQKTASPSTYSSTQRHAQGSTSPSPFSASQTQPTQTHTQKSASTNSFGSNMQKPAAAPSTYSTATSSQRQTATARASASPNPYSAGQGNSTQQKAAASPSSYTNTTTTTPSQRQAAPGSASPNPYSSSSQSQSQSQSKRQAQAQTQQRSVSPNPYAASVAASSPRQAHRSVSPNPYAGSQHRNSVSSQRGATPTRGGGGGSEYFRGGSPGDAAAARASSPSVYRGGDYGRPDSRDSRAGAADMAIQLAPVGGNGGGGDPYGSMRSSRSGGRPGTSSSSRTAFGASGGSYGGGGGGGGGAMTFYDGRDPMQEGSRQRSQSVADPSRQYTRDGRAILHYARALYMYQAAIPEELGFSKGDVLAVVRHQDDGWWEAEIHSGQGVGMTGLVPSNYLQVC